MRRRMAHSLVAPVLRPLKHLRVRAGCLTGLDFLWLEITGRRNLACGHCYAELRSAPPTQRAHDGRGLVPRDDRSPRRGLPADCSSSAVSRRCTRSCRSCSSTRPAAASAGAKSSPTPRSSGASSCARSRTSASTCTSPSTRTTRRCTTRSAGSRGATPGPSKVSGSSCGSGVRLSAGIILMPQNAGHAARQRSCCAARRSPDWHRIGCAGVGRGERFAAGTTPNELCGECWKGTLCVDTERRRSSMCIHTGHDGWQRL